MVMAHLWPVAADMESDISSGEYLSPGTNKVADEGC